MLSVSPNSRGRFHTPRWVEMSAANGPRMRGMTQPVASRRLTQHRAATFDTWNATSDADSPPPTTRTRLPSNGAAFL